MQGAPGTGLVRGQRGQVGKIEASAPALGARARTDHGIRAPWPEQYAADTAGPRFCRHFSLSPSVLSEILTLVRPFKVGLFVTAAATFAHCHSHFLKIHRPWMPRGARVKAKNHSIVNNMSNPTNHPPSRSSLQTIGRSRAPWSTRTAAARSLFDHLVGAQQNRLRHRKATRKNKRIELRVKARASN
jgi:hypothetical protein